MRSPITRTALTLALVALLGAPAQAAGGAADAERLVRARYFDSIPFEEVRGLDAAGAARLRQLLADPAEVARHAQILEFIGIRGGPGAYEALSRYAARQPAGEVGADVFRARMALPVALGHLARSDDRALAALVLAAARPTAAPSWSHARFRGAQLALQVRRMQLMGLALSGRRHAAALLARLSTDPALARSAAAARALNRRIAREGAAAVYASGAGTSR